MARLFGTDGIRGVANVDLKPTMAYALGRATAQAPRGARVGASSSGRTPGARATCSWPPSRPGATSLGVDVHVVGVVPTPALAYLARTGAVPRRDHGLGLAQPGRRQRPQGARRRRAQARRRDRGGARGPHLARGRARRRRQRHARSARRRGRRRRALPRRIGVGLAAVDRAQSGLHIVLDGANGSGGCARPRDPRLRPAPGSMRSTSSRTGSTSTSTAGATAPASLARAVGGARRGRRVRPRRRRRPADRGRWAGTHRRWRPGPRASSPSSGSHATRCPAASSCRSCPTAGSSARSRRPAARSSGRPVGDKYILEGMQVSGATLGGEKSGHVIVLEHTTSGDGIVTALEVLRVMTAAQASLATSRRRSRCSPAAARGQGAPQGPMGGRSDPAPGDRRRHRTAGRARDGSSSGRPARSPRCGSWSRATTRRS